jgi:hypothetical protein
MNTSYDIHDEMKCFMLDKRHDVTTITSLSVLGKSKKDAAFTFTTITKIKYLFYDKTVTL